MTSSVPINDVSDLIGREAELEVLDAVIDQIHVRGGALIVRGEAGIGKSALLRRARARVRARGGRVLSTVGVELEAELALAGLHQLLHPIIGLTGRLSEAQPPTDRPGSGVQHDRGPGPS